MPYRKIDGPAQAAAEANAAGPLARAARIVALLLAIILLESLLASAARADSDFREELHCLALNIYFEARNQPEIGQRAVGHVVLNRVQDPRFPDTICEVVQDGGDRTLHRCQFSWWCDGMSDEPRDARAWKASVLIASYVYWGFSKDPTHGALWYHADYVRPAWRKAFLRGPGIGRHIFYLTSEDETAGDAARPTATQLSQGERRTPWVPLERLSPDPRG